MSRETFRIPNNPEGQLFVRLMRKFLNKGEYNWRRYGRGKRKGLPDYMINNRKVNHEELKVPYADSWCLYLKKKE